MTLHRFFEDGHTSLSRFRHAPDHPIDSDSFATALGSVAELRERLQIAEPGLLYQIITVATTTSTGVYGSDMRNSPVVPACIVDALGLELDIPPDLWLLLLGKLRRANVQRSNAWVRKDRLLEVGNDVLAILHQSQLHRHRTGE